MSTAAAGDLRTDALRYHEHHLSLARPFGSDAFGRRAEAFARFFGTPRFLIGQTIAVVAWIAVNGAGLVLRWDPYPFILLNLAFSTQAAYAAPLILLAQTRQADRDKALAKGDARHREAIAGELRKLLEANTGLTAETKTLAERLDRLTQQIHAQVCSGSP